jgi:hypothetical protein
MPMSNINSKDLTKDYKHFKTYQSIAGIQKSLSVVHSIVILIHLLNIALLMTLKVKNIFRGSLVGVAEFIEQI